MKENAHGRLMPSIEEVVASSMSINSRLPAQLEKALERNIVLRIGWTTNGDPVPKDGELGLCPNLPKGSKILLEKKRVSLLRFIRIFFLSAKN